MPRRYDATDHYANTVILSSLRRVTSRPTAPHAPRRPVWRALWLWGPPAALMLLIFFASSLPSLGAPARIPDKMLHFAAYAVLAALVLRALAGGAWSRLTRRHIATAIAAATVYGISDEWHQAFVPPRAPELGDVIADAIGAAAGAGALWTWGIIRQAARGF